MNRLAIGTAQFGLDYGVANLSGRVSRPEIRHILDVGTRAGIDLLDTAIAYGDSEDRLGAAGTASWKLVSKLPGLPDVESDVAGWVRDQIEGSLRRLRRSSLYGLLLHRPLDLLSSRGDALASALQAIKREGLVARLGVSIYDPAQLSALLDCVEMQLVQAPFSIVDRRLLTSGWLERLSKRGIEVHARSVFLQGVLLQPRSSRPAMLARWAALWDAWDRWLSEEGITPLEACLRFVLSHSGIRYAVVGVDRAEQLEATVEAAEGFLPTPPAALSVDDPALVDPSQWMVG